MENEIDKLEERGSLALQYIQDYAPKVVGALLTLIIGWRIVNWIGKITTRKLEHSNIDTTVSKFLSSLIGITLKVLLLISVAGMFGIKTTSFVAVLGAAGLAIGLSLQGSLSNFAGGVIILIFKPYEVGDFVEIKGVTGHVSEISVLNTMIITLDNNNAIIPNGPIINDIIINYTKKESVRVDVPVGISYSADIDQARQVLLDMVSQQDIILDDPTPEVLVDELGGSSVNLILRVHCPSDDARKTRFQLTELAKKALDDASIEIPFPQRVVHMHKEE